MDHQTFTETALPKPGGVGPPVVITHELYNTVHGIVQGWTTADGGKPVAVADQRSTFNHEVDSGVGFLHFNTPSLTTSPQTWQAGAALIQSTFKCYPHGNDLGRLSGQFLCVRLHIFVVGRYIWLSRTAGRPTTGPGRM